LQIAIKFLIGKTISGDDQVDRSRLLTREGKTPVTIGECLLALRRIGADPSYRGPGNANTRRIDDPAGNNRLPLRYGDLCSSVGCLRDRRRLLCRSGKSAENDAQHP